MEEKLLGSDASHKPTGNESTGSRRSVVRQKRWKRTTGNHQRWTLSFQLNLAEKARNLHGVDRRTFSSRLDHQRQVIVGELSQQAARNASPGNKNTIITQISSDKNKYKKQTD